MANVGSKQAPSLRPAEPLDTQCLTFKGHLCAVTYGVHYLEFVSYDDWYFGFQVAFYFSLFEPGRREGGFTTDVPKMQLWNWQK